jgi:hypothetical protein
MEFIADDKWWLDTGVVNLREVRRMQDVEFMSELFIALIAGPQDKKKTLDEYFANYDGSMPQETEWVGSFEQVRDFIRTLLPPDELRKWKGKSDFYSLFLALAPLAERSPRLASNEREAVRSVLKIFRAEVDQAKRKDDATEFPVDVKEYAEAVTRAASDLGRRNARLRILESRLQRALASIPKRTRAQTTPSAA